MIQTEGRTYEIAASSKEDMQCWMEATMKAALGLPSDAAGSGAPRADSAVADEPWLRFHCVGCWCECCFESVPAVVRQIAGVEVVRLDAGREMLLVKRSGPVAELIVGTLEERFGFSVTLLDKGQNV